MATLKDVARLACVDISTVSRAFEQYFLCSSRNKKSGFTAAAKELGYQPNVMAQALAPGEAKDDRRGRAASASGDFFGNSSGD